MVSPLEIEQQAAQLRTNLRHAHTPELRLLCLLKFFELFDQPAAPNAESYVREFFPALTAAAAKSDAAEFLPNEIASLRCVRSLMVLSSPDFVPPEDLAAVDSLLAQAESPDLYPLPSSDHDSEVAVTCLFVEHYPDLGLEPRGRLLRLHVAAEKTSSRLDEDDIIVRNPVDEPDDRFLAQARDSVTAARTFLQIHTGLSPNQRYRFDFRINTTGARYTGDSSASLSPPGLSPR